MSRVETIRHEIMMQLYGYRPMARDGERMAGAARREGELPDANAAEFERECAYLTGKGLAELDASEIAQGHKRWKITAAGVDWLESKGLI